MSRQSPHKVNTGAQAAFGPLARLFRRDLRPKRHSRNCHLLSGPPCRRRASDERWRATRSILPCARAPDDRVALCPCSRATGVRLRHCDRHAQVRGPNLPRSPVVCFTRSIPLECGKTASWLRLSDKPDCGHCSYCICIFCQHKYQTLVCHLSTQRNLMLHSIRHNSGDSPS